MQDLTPRLVAEAEAKKLGVRHGWYGARVSGTLMTGPCATRDECAEAIRLLPDIAAASAAVAPENTAGASDARRSITSVYELSSQISAGRVGYKPSRQGKRQ